MKKLLTHFDAAGWPFWTVLFVLLLGPCIYGVASLTFKGVGWYIPIIVGVVCASVGAGLIAWGVNSVLQSRQKKLQIVARKAAKRRK